MIAYSAPVPAREGFEWLQLSWRIFRAHWQRYVSIAALFLLILQVASALTGGLLFMFLKPILSVGFLAAAWHHERGELPQVRHLFAGFKSNLRALVPLGGVYLIGIFIAASIGLAVSGLNFDQLRALESQQTLPADALLRFMLVTLALTLPLTAALWFAPALIVFSDATFFQSLVVSTRAYLSNWLSMSVYGISMFGMLLLSVMLIAPLLFVLSAPLQMAAVVLLLVPVTAIQMISDYVSYRRVFHREERVEKIAS